jgi:hypothetical protein
MDNLYKRVAGGGFCGRWIYRGWGNAATWKGAEGYHHKLACAMFQENGRLGRSAFVDAVFEGAPGEGVGEEQVIDDALDTPFVRI